MKNLLVAFTLITDNWTWTRKTGKRYYLSCIDSKLSRIYKEIIL